MLIKSRGLNVLFNTIWQTGCEVSLRGVTFPGAHCFSLLLLLICTVEQPLPFYISLHSPGCACLIWCQKHIS